MKKSSQQRDAGPTVFGWDEEPAEERPSGFAHSSHQGPASGYYRGGSVHPVRTQRKSGLGWGAVVVFVVLVIGLVAAALRWLVPLLHR